MSALLLTAPNISLLGVGLLLLAIARIVEQGLFSSLRAVPGPISARFSRLWYLRNVSKGTFHETNIRLHKKYGKAFAF